MVLFMSYPGKQSVPRSGAELPLSDANKVLKADYVAGMDRVLFGPDNKAITVQGSGDTESGIFSLPQKNYLARLAFLELEDACTDREVRPFRLAVVMKAHLIDVEQAISMPEDEIRKLGYTWPDCVNTTLLDVTLQNIHRNSICFQKNIGEQGEFEVNGQTSGYIDSAEPDDDLVNSAYDIATGLGTGAFIDQTGLNSHLEPYKVTVDVLNRGEPDLIAIDTFDEATLNNDGIRLLPEDSTAADKVRPYLYAMFRKAVETPSLRITLAWQQYWYDRGRS